jgi:ribosomal-protein-alanine N-acetyltransferase
MTRDDLEEVWEIERHSFRSPWSVSQFKSELKNDLSRAFTVKGKICGKVQVVGYTIFWLVAGEAHFLNITVHHRYRHQGIGSRLLNFSLELCKDSGIKEALLEVRPSNTTAQQFYRKFGFRIVGLRKAYYADNKEDALLMTLKM